MAETRYLTNNLSCAMAGCGFPIVNGLGFSISEQARRWTQLTCEFGKRP